MIIDMSSICWSCLLPGEDKEFGYKVEFEGKDFQINSAKYGYENAVNHFVMLLEKLDMTPMNMVMVVEGENSKLWRTSIMETYKGGKGPTRPREAYEEFNKLKELLVDTFTSLGGVSVSQPGIESDDVIAYLCHNLDGEKVIDSADRDLCALISDEYGNTTQGVKQWWFTRNEMLTSNPFGPFPCRHIVTYKSLVGDSGDKIPGCPGFGEKAWLNLLVAFGNEGLDAMLELIQRNQLDELHEDVPQLKVLQKVIDQKDTVIKSYRCAKLYPEKINIARRPLEIRAGMVKPRVKGMDERLAKWAGQTRLAHAGNFDAAVKFMRQHFPTSPFLSFDIETSSCDEGDAWLQAAKGKSDGDDIGVDVFGAKLAGFSITFGQNMQYTFYFTVDHVEEDGVINITMEQAEFVLDLMPPEKVRAIQNVSFELPVIMENLGELDSGKDWHGFIPNAHDTKIMCNYVDENGPSGLKQNSKKILGYEQQDYASVTTMEGVADDLPKGGRLIGEPIDDPDGGPQIVKKQYRMNELTAKRVLAYGCDDTICTAALYNYYKFVMELERTWDVYLQVEVKPAYLTALAFTQGIETSIQKLKEFETEDEKTFAEAQAVLSRVLLSEGILDRLFEPIEDLTAATARAAFLELYGIKLESKARKMDKLAAFIRVEAGEWAENFAHAVETEDLGFVNGLLLEKYKSAPAIDIDSPKQMRRFLYDILKLPIRAINKLTALEKKEKKELAEACFRFTKAAMKGEPHDLSAEELELIKVKAKTDDTAVDLAILFDADDIAKTILESMMTMKTVATRRKLYYKPYPYQLHWKDKRIHSSMNQCATVTRRYSSSGPNLQQLPKKGEGVKIRQVILPHHKDAVVISLDFSGQELRLAADYSQDENMLSCYIGENKKDIHSITAAGAMRRAWGPETVAGLIKGVGLDNLTDNYDIFVALRESKDKVVHKKADDLRKGSKNVNFGAQYDAQALTLSYQLLMPVKDAQDFLDARAAMFPRVDEWKDEVRSEVEAKGYATTKMGARRHLHRLLMDPITASKAGRQGPNFNIQGSGAEMTKLAMGKVWDSSVCYDYDCRFYAPVHDELVFSAHKDQALDVIRIVHECMTGQYADMVVPVMSSISLGPNFGEQTECGDWLIPENIQKALDDVFRKKEIA